MQYYDNYVQRNKPEHGVKPETTDNVLIPAVTNAQEYKKLAAVFGVIALCATIMSFVLGFDIQIWLEWFAGGLCIIFGSFKLIGYEAFVTMFPKYTPLGKRYSFYTYLYPFLQLFLGFLYVSNLLPFLRDTLAIAVFGYGVFSILKYTASNPSGARIAYLGGIINMPISTVSLIEDVLMSGMAVIMLVSYFLL